LDSDWLQVALGAKDALALKGDGSLWTWERKARGQVAQTNFFVHYGTPARLGTESNWTQICAGGFHSLALKSDGSLWAWGNNMVGQLGNGATNNASLPTLIGTDRDWQTIAATTFASFAVKTNGTLWTWGYVGLGRPVLVPMQIAPGTNWCAVSGSHDMALALKTDSTLWQGLLVPYPVSRDFFRQISQDSDWTEVHCGRDWFLSRKKDGAWWVCGQNYARQLGLGTNATEKASPQRLTGGIEPWAFAQGGNPGTTLLLCKDGKLWTWGKRLGVEKPSAAQRKFQSILSQVVGRFPFLHFLIKSDVDETPRLLWELPREVRRSLGVGPNSTNYLTAGHSVDASHE
jgi:alpha-tubulin suppressor-like RCC1 family protein